jgi:CRP/FNR family transcriptional regulator, cyclic AMP receptor protein
MLEADLLQGLPATETEPLLALGRRMLITAGAELFHLGDAADCVYLIARGSLRLTLPMQVRGREENVFVEEHAAGQTVGWSGLIPPYRFTLTATAAVDTEVIVLPREALNQYFAAHPAIGYAASMNLAGTIGQRLQLFQAMWLREVQRMVESRCA